MVTGGWKSGLEAISDNFQRNVGGGQAGLTVTPLPKGFHRKPTPSPFPDPCWMPDTALSTLASPQQKQKDFSFERARKRWFSHDLASFENRPPPGAEWKGWMGWGGGGGADSVCGWRGGGFSSACVQVRVACLSYCSHSPRVSCGPASWARSPFRWGSQICQFVSTVSHLLAPLFALVHKGDDLRSS